MNDTRADFDLKAIRQAIADRRRKWIRRYNKGAKQFQIIKITRRKLVTIYATNIWGGHVRFQAKRSRQTQRLKVGSQLRITMKDGKPLEDWRPV